MGVLRLSARSTARARRVSHHLTSRGDASSNRRASPNKGASANFDPAENNCARTESGSPPDARCKFNPILRAPQHAVRRSGARPLIIYEKNAMADENIVLDRHAIANECVALDLA